MTDQKPKKKTPPLKMSKVVETIDAIEKLMKALPKRYQYMVLDYLRNY